MLPPPPPPPISRHSWQAQRRGGDKDGKGARKWWGGRTRRPEKAGGQEGALQRGIPRGVSARPAAPTETRGARDPGLQDTEMPGSWELG